MVYQRIFLKSWIFSKQNENLCSVRCLCLLGLSKQNEIDESQTPTSTDSTDYVAKTPLSPTAGCEAPEEMLSTDTTSQFNVTVSTSCSQKSNTTTRDRQTTSTSASAAIASQQPTAGTPTLKTTQTLELIQR